MESAFNSMLCFHFLFFRLINISVLFRFSVFSPHKSVLRFPCNFNFFLFGAAFSARPFYVLLHHQKMLKTISVWRMSLTFSLFIHTYFLSISQSDITRIVFTFRFRWLTPPQLLLSIHLQLHWDTSIGSPKTGLILISTVYACAIFLTYKCCWGNDDTIGKLPKI